MNLLDVYTARYFSFLSFSHKLDHSYFVTFSADIVSILCCQTVFTEEQRKIILAEVKLCRMLASNPNIAYSPYFYYLVFVPFPHLTYCSYAALGPSSLMFSLIEVLVEWRSGHIQAAIDLAVNISQNISSRHVLLGYLRSLLFTRIIFLHSEAALL